MIGFQHLLFVGTGCGFNNNIDEQFLLSPYVYARGLARDVDETVSSVSVVLHRMCTTKQFLLSVLSWY